MESGLASLLMRMRLGMIIRDSKINSITYSKMMELGG